MEILINILILVGTFILMEGAAWFAHKYIMHGFLWVLHKDHHKKDHNSFFERNDTFFVIFATPSSLLIYFGLEGGGWNDPRVWMGFGIAAYGLAYFFVHDIFIHQRAKVLKKADHWYLKGIRKAHKIHHKHLGKEEGECFGMLYVPKRYYKEYKQNG